MGETFKFAHAEYLGPATVNDSASNSVRATEVPIAVALLYPCNGSVSPTQLGTAFVLPAISNPEVPKSTRYTRTYTIPPPLDRMAMKTRRKRRKVIAGVVGGTVGLAVLGPLGAIGIGIGSALIVKHADRARERKLLDAHQGHGVQGGTGSSSQ